MSQLSSDSHLTSLLELFHAQSQLTLVISAVIIAAYAIYRFTTPSIPLNPKLSFPVVGKSTDVDFRKALLEGGKMYPNTPFVLPTPMKPIVVLPLSAIDEIKTLPESTISLRLHHYMIHSGRYTNFGADNTELEAAIRINLTRNVEQMLDTFQDEVPYAFEQNIGLCKEWTAVHLYPKMLRVVALLSSRAFVGLPLSRTEDWVHTTVNYTVDGAAGAHKLIPYPHWLRFFVAPFLLTSLKKHQKYATKMMEPLLAQFVRNGLKYDGDDNNEEIIGGNLISYLIQHYKGKVSAEQLGKDQLAGTYASIHTTTICLTQAIFDLAARPEYVQPLRDEYLATLAECQKKDGLIHNFSVSKLKKLDSFIRESQRMNPPGLVTMLRVVTKPEGLKLSSGAVIPQGATCSISNFGITQSYKNPEKFDGNRFYDLRKQPGQETKWQLVGTGPDALSFGHGTHACPGRFFAGNEIKIIMLYLMMNYDIKLKDGESRPSNGHKGCIVWPPKDAEIEVKARK